VQLHYPLSAEKPIGFQTVRMMSTNSPFTAASVPQIQSHASASPMQHLKSRPPPRWLLVRHPVATLFESEAESLSANFCHQYCRGLRHVLRSTKTSRRDTEVCKLGPLWSYESVLLDHMQRSVAGFAVTANLERSGSERKHTSALARVDCCRI
jgi:hypothetical protein